MSPPSATEKLPGPIPAATPLDILIVGGGIGGLSTAYLLGKAGHKVTIVETAPAFGEVGAGIQLSPNVTRLFERWGLGEKLKEIAVVPKNLTFCRYEDGDVVGWTEWGTFMQKDFGAPYYHVHRADLLNILIEAATPVSNVRTNSRVVEVDPSTPSVTLASGEVIKADIIIGADGLKSVVKPVVTGQNDNPRPTGDACYRATIPAKLLLADPDLKDFIVEQNCTIWMGPGKHIVAYCVRNKELYNLVMIHPARETNENVRGTSLEQMKEDFAEFEPRVRKLLNLVPEAMVWSLLDRLPLETWVHSEGKVALLGDACHPMLPYRAQGAAMALEDAAVLSDVLNRLTNKEKIGDYLKAYEHLRHARASQTQADARRNQYIFHLEDGPAQRERDANMREQMMAALFKKNNESSRFAGGSNQWGDKDKTCWAFGYDAYKDTQKWFNDHSKILDA